MTFFSGEVEEGGKEGFFRYEKGALGVFLGKDGGKNVFSLRKMGG